MPTAASTRPQFGSEPNSAVLTRLSRATTRAAVDGVVLGGGTGDRDGDALGDALGVGLQLRAQVVADRSTASSSSAWLGAISLAPGCQQQHGVVGRAAAVDVEPVEGLGRGVAQRPVECVGVGDRVGGDDAQHGGQRRRQHARALGHPADRPVVRVVQRNLFGDGVGGHDGLGRLGAAGQAARHLVHDRPARP